MFSKRSICALLVLAGSAASCSCEEQLNAAVPNFKASVSSVAYGLVCLESDNTKEVTLQNIGASQGNVTWTIAPAGRETDAAMFTTSPEGTQTTNVPAGGSQVITVTYHPSDSRAGDVSQLGEAHKAVLRISTDDPEHETIEIILDGTVSDRVPTPILSVTCPDGVPACSGGDEPCCSAVEVPAGVEGSNGRWRLIQTYFGTAVSGTSREMKVVLSNLGCGQLDISKDWTFESFGECEASTLKIPELETGLTLAGSPTQDQIQKREVTLRFDAPQDSCTLFGDAILATNDPVINEGGAAASWGKLKVNAVGSAPDISIIPVGGLAFGEVNDGMCVEKTLVIQNTSAVAIKLDPLEIVPGFTGKGTDYKVKKVVYDPSPCDGTFVDWNFADELQPNDGQGGCGDDELRVTIEYCPGTGNDLTTDNDELLVKFTGGQVRTGLKGGSNPELKVVGVDFGDKTWFGPKHFGCVACGAKFCPASVCTSDTDCAGESCLKVQGDATGYCASAPGCLDRCGTSDRAVLLCNEGKGDLVITSVSATAPDGGTTGSFDVFVNDCLNKVIKERTTDADCCPITVSADSGAAGRIDDALGNLVIKSNDATFPGTVPISYLFELGTGDGYQQALARLKVYDGTCTELSPTDHVKVGDTVYFDASASTSVVNFRWSVDAVATGSSVPLGSIDLVSPDARFFEVGRLCDGGTALQRNTALAFKPDFGERPVFAKYTITVKVDDGTCAADPPDTTSKIVQVSDK